MKRMRRVLELINLDLQAVSEALLKSSYQTLRAAFNISLNKLRKNDLKANYKNKQRNSSFVCLLKRGVPTLRRKNLKTCIVFEFATGSPPNLGIVSTLGLFGIIGLPATSFVELYKKAKQHRNVG
uniref:Uncharacterized protein n=1 Tax=Glossina austeni TaxID=7395 RepID=A0A1A9VJ43_GLOAU